VKPGDVLTFPQAKQVRVIRIDALGTRRGPAPEAQALYTDLSPPEPRSEAAPQTASVRATGKPSKADRRAHDLLSKRMLE